MDPLLMHRIHFGFTVTFHYLFPQLTMGLALLIVIFKTIAIRTGNSLYQDAARFWGKIFAVNFIMGHVDTSMAAHYRERISDERLVAVTEHVRRWLSEAPDVPDGE